MGQVKSVKLNFVSSGMQYLWMQGNSRKQDRNVIKCATVLNGQSNFEGTTISDVQLCSREVASKRNAKR